MFWNNEPTKASITDPLIVGSLNLPVDITDWSAQNWVDYYKTLKAKLGKDKAQSYFLTDIDKIGFWDNANNYKYDCDFVNYFKGEGFQVGNLFSNIYCSTTTSIYNTLDTVQNITDSAKKVSNYTPLIIIGAIGLIGYIAYQNYGSKKRKR